MDTYTKKQLIKKFLKLRTKENYKVLENFIDDKESCRICNDSVYYEMRSRIRLDLSNMNFKYDLNQPTCKTFKEINGIVYKLSVCEKCLIEKFKNEYTSMNTSRVFNTINNISSFAFNIPDSIGNSFKKSICPTLNKMLSKYGEELGKKKWDHYCNLQSVTNSFEYKKEKYGWDENDFKQFNKSRAVTLKNMISKYGEEEGTKSFNDYCEKQRTNGNTLEYFIAKYGEEGGTEKYRSVNILKSENNNSPITVSKISQEFFDKLDYYFKEFTTFYYKKNTEFTLKSDSFNNVFKPDYYIKELNICIEFFGDYYHANPKKYNSNFIFTWLHNSPKAIDIWERDRIRIENIKKYFDSQTIIVWESDYYKNRDNPEFYKKIVKECINK